MSILWGKTKSFINCQSNNEGNVINMFEAYIPTLEYIATGAFYGAEAALFGFLKSEELPISWKVLFSKDFWTKFDAVKALKTVLIGMVLGAWTNGTLYMPQIAEALNVTTSDPTYLAVLATVPSLIVFGVDAFVKFVVRRTPLVRVWNGIKAYALKILQAKEDLVKAAKETPA